MVCEGVKTVSRLGREQEAERGRSPELLDHVAMCGLSFGTPRVAGRADLPCREHGATTKRRDYSSRVFVYIEVASG